MVDMPLNKITNQSTNDASQVVMVSDLVHQTIDGEFYSHWVPHTFVLVVNSGRIQAC